MRLLVLGAGWLGGTFARAEAADGAAVVAVRRAPPDAASADAVAGVTFLRGDVARPESIVLPPAFVRLDAVALTIAPRDGDYGVYASGARAAVALARRHGAGFLLYTSSTGVYAAGDGETVDETSPLGGDPRSRSLAEAEEILVRESPAPVAILRLSGLYGPGRPSLGRYADPARFASGGPAFTNRIRLEDAVSALRFVLARRAAGVFNVTDDDPADALDVSTWLAGRRGETASSAASRRAVQAPPSGRRISNGRLRSLGWAPRFPSFREGFADLT